MKASSRGWVHDLARDIRIGILICTRLPLGSPPRIESFDLVRASWALPVAGALVGAAGAWAFWIASELRLPPALAAALAACTWLGPACASEPLHCGRFAQETLPSPIPQKGVHALDRAEEITGRSNPRRMLCSFSAIH